MRGRLGLPLFIPLIFVVVTSCRKAPWQTVSPGVHLGGGVSREQADPPIYRIDISVRNAGGQEIAFDMLEAAISPSNGAPSRIVMAKESAGRFSEFDVVPADRQRNLFIPAPMSIPASATTRWTIDRAAYHPDNLRYLSGLAADAGQLPLILHVTFWRNGRPVIGPYIAALPALAKTPRTETDSHSEDPRGALLDFTPLEKGLNGASLADVQRVAVRTDRYRSKMGTMEKAWKGVFDDDDANDMKAFLEAAGLTVIEQPAESDAIITLRSAASLSMDDVVAVEGDLSAKRAGRELYTRRFRGIDLGFHGVLGQASLSKVMADFIDPSRVHMAFGEYVCLLPYDLVAAGWGPKRASDAMIALLRDGDHRRRINVLQAMGASRSMAFIPPILDVMRQDTSPEGRERYWGSKALADMGSVATPGVVSVLQNRNESVAMRLVAADTLQEAAKWNWARQEPKDLRAVQGLIGALGDHSDQVRSAAARALGEIGERSAADALNAALADPSPEVRSSVARALEKVSR